MTTSPLHLLPAAILAAVLALPAVPAEARPARPAAKPAVSDAHRSREAALHGFDTRMSRLDALMGAAPARAGRARSADAAR